ncbi:hypothetical protein N657DRAFT_678956 [Parathielavia appendiculata]|uniref:Aminoglycoside phosphotransferase domain-containing protein n=1 Tax=Parathielavia appendiculata TaxID=2587402 RepID=A0AAN6U442_9PEZI|nr:hypothetical protein N657DRAFT_678956 [Parathielavia appendiculata]
MNELARFAASLIAADRCVHVQECPDGFHDKAYLFRTNYGREVICKVPNPNAGVVHHTIASEVVTMHYVRNLLSTPASMVLAWNYRAESNAVGAEYIIMKRPKAYP